MAILQWFPPVLSFLGAALGALVVYRLGRGQEQSRRFEAALELLASSDPRQRALGRARVVELCRQDLTGPTGRREALAVLREDVHAACPESVRRGLGRLVAGDGAAVRVAEDGETRLQGAEVFVARPILESALAYVELAGGPDAAPDQLVARLSEAVLYEPHLVGSSAATTGAARAHDTSTRALPDDQPLLLVKLSSDAATLSSDELCERARKAWRLSINRLRLEPPAGVAAVADHRVIGAWQYQGAEPSTDEPGRVELMLGESMPDLIGCEFHDTGQNPVRYWP